MGLLTPPLLTTTYFYVLTPLPPPSTFDFQSQTEGGFELGDPRLVSIRDDKSNTSREAALGGIGRPAGVTEVSIALRLCVALKTMTCCRRELR